MAAPVLEERRVLTPEEFLAMEDAVAYEMCDDGTIQERDMSQESEEIGARLVIKMGSFVVEHRLGTVFGPVALRIFPARPRRIPRADIVFISHERRNRQAERRLGPLTVAPELVAEVVSTWDRATDVDAKVSEYLSGGVDLVWVLYPETRHVSVFRADGTTSRVGPGDTLSGETAVPGFECAVTDLFPAPDVAGSD